VETDLYKRCRPVFDEVVSLPPEDREERLRELCSGDRRLEVAVLSLLEGDESPGLEHTLDLSPVPDDTEAPHATPPAPLRPQADYGRYEDLGPLGQGGMGEVRRVRDPDLNRVMAMKLCRAELMTRSSIVARFVQEAQCAAQLQHPGIVPVHEIGTLPDGRSYFTMQVVHGRTLGEIIEEVHEGGLEDGDREWTFRGLVEAFAKVCDAMAYAHERGVIHRDLKPANVMVGPHGTVLVVDWGVAKVLGRRDWAAEAGDLDPVVTERSRMGLHATRVGAVAGTPAYMAPEQARGEVARIDRRSDVYALGAILYEVLSGRAPYDARDSMAVLRKVLAGPPEPPARPADRVSAGLPPETTQDIRTATGPAVPAELLAACLRAMERDPDDRFPDASSLSSAIASWLAGSRRREQALAVVNKAATKASEADALRARAAVLRKEAGALLKGVERWRPEEDKAAGWTKEDEARSLERSGDLVELEQELQLHAALSHAPRLPEAHAALAARYRAEHAAAERDRGETTRPETLLRLHTAALPEHHPDRADHAAYLRGDGALTLVTDPPGAEVDLHRYELHNRRLVPVFQRSLGRTPLVEVPLHRGSYLCTVRRPGLPDGGRPVRYPVCIGRGEHWDGIPPGSTTPEPVRLPTPGTLGPHEQWMPAGWFWCGGDSEASEALPRRRLWCHDLIVQRFPVTNEQYLAFLDDLVARGREQEALLHVPRERSASLGESGAMLYGRGADGRFELTIDSDGDQWYADHPVMMVGWLGAVAYAEWLSARTGLPYRLLGELEREKAARGVDGRFFPWGDTHDSAWSCGRFSHQSRATPKSVTSHPVDESPFGVRGVAGGVRDWCLDGYTPEGPDLSSRRVAIPVLGDPTSKGRRGLRGGSWNSVPRNARCAYRGGNYPWVRGAAQGFRLAREPEE